MKKVSNKIFIDARSLTNNVLDGKNNYSRCIIKALLKNKPKNCEMILISDQRHSLVDIVIDSNWHLNIAKIVDRKRNSYFFSPLSYITPFFIKKAHSLVVVHDLIAINQPMLVPIKAMIIENIFLRLLYFKKNLSFICVSRTTKKYLKKFKNFNQNIISSTIGVPFKTKISVSKSDYLLCFQSISERKNQIMLLESLKIIKPKKRPKLILAGSYEKNYLKKVNHFIKNNKLESYVEIIKNVTDEKKVDLISRARVSIFPNKIEGFGIPLIESLKLNTPILTHDIPVFNEINLDKVSRFKSVKQLTKLISNLTNEDLTNILTNQKKDLEKYDYNLIARNLLSTLR